METENIGIYFIIAWIAIFILSGSIFLFHLYYKSYLHRVEKEKQIIAFRAAVNAEEIQKENIANMIHDEIIHLLVAAGHHLEQDNEQNNKKAAVLVEQAVTGLKSIAIDLIPKTLLNFGLVHALEQHAVLLNTNDDCVIEIENNTNFMKKTPFLKSDEVIIYRMCLEIFSNLRKHANYSYLRVIVEDRDNTLIFDFTHNGIGVTNEQIEQYSISTSGLGLKSLQSRLLVLNATINYSKEFGASSIRLNIPYNYARKN